MEGIIDLTFEAHTDLDNLPSAAGHGWLAADLSPADWTVPLDDTALAELRAMVTALKQQPLPTLLRRPQQFDIPALTKAYGAAKDICDKGVGFAVIDRQASVQVDRRFFVADNVIPVLGAEGSPRYEK